MAARRVVLVCNGNAGNISNRLERALEMQRLGVSVLLFDYRGYGRSEGSPDEEGPSFSSASRWGRRSPHSSRWNGQPAL